MRAHRACATAAHLLASLAVALLPGVAGAAPVTQCHADETPYFSCVTGAKVVSLCGAGQASAISRLTYRYGKPGQVELEFTATAGGSHFMATLEPDSPRAEVREVWFDRCDIRYLMHTCLGGDCPYRAGLAVLRGPRVLSNARCQRDPAALDYFAPALVEFGDDPAHSHSHSPLLELGDFTNRIERLYPIPASAYP